MEILSAPARRISRKSSTVRMPPPTVTGTKTSRQVRRTTSAIVSRLKQIARRGNVEKYDLVRALLRIELRKLDRVACVAQTDEIHALDHAAVLDVQTGDNAFCQHHLRLL